MKRNALPMAAAMAITVVFADDTLAIKGADADLVRSIGVIGERIAGIVRAGKAPALVPVRADEATRSAEALKRARGLLSPEASAARGRAWQDLGLGSGTEPQDLVVALERDLPGMTFDTARTRLLVDPGRLLSDVGHADPDQNADASILLATGVAPDEPVAGHYLAHALLDGPGLSSPVTTDALLAQSAWEEGSANLAALVLLFGGVGLEAEVVSGAVRPEDSLGGRLVPDGLQQASPVVAHLLGFSYLDGFAQVASVVRKGGFPRLAQDRKSRRTTSDLLHLDRPPTPPAPVLEAPLPATTGLVPVDRDSLGEQGIVTMVSLLTGKDNLGLIAGDGWVADTLWRYEPGPGSSAETGDGATVWVTQWKTEEDAKDFAYSVERVLAARFPEATLKDDPERGGRVLSRGDRVYRLEHESLRVVFKVLPPFLDVKLGPAPKKKVNRRPPPPRKK